MPVHAFTDEQSRTLINLAQRYGMWIEAERALAALPYDLRRKEVGGRAYLYEISDRGGNGRSLGPWSPELERRFTDFRQAKTTTRGRRDSGARALQETGRLYRALRLPLLASEAGAVLREADRRGMLGTSILLVGTNAMPAYAIEANGAISDAPDETEDLDFAWSAEVPADAPQLWPMLKAVDSTYTINTERPFQARNAKAYEVELLVAPSRADSLSRLDQPRPVPLPEQEWLLAGRPVDHVVVCRDGSPARIVAPDPRWFALQKLWLANQPKRNPLKRAKDRKQGTALLDAVATVMTHYPLDEAFQRELPPELGPVYSEWSRSRPQTPEPSW
jgi:hypothetical protein